MSKTINQALADLVTGLGADPSVLSDNATVSDYIEDLSGAIKGETEALIDDEEASETKTYSSSKIESIIPEIDDSASSETKTYSSSKIESLIPADELPAVTVADNNRVLAVVNGAWTLCTMTAVADTTSGAVTFTFTPVTPAPAPETT